MKDEIAKLSKSKIFKIATQKCEILMRDDKEKQEKKTLVFQILRKSS